MNLPQIVDKEEPITRYLFKDDFTISNSNIKPVAFAPSKKTKNLSVYRIKDAHENDIWDIGRQYVTALRSDNKEVLARADLYASDFFDDKLNIIPEIKIHFRHANIENWPVNSRDELLMIRNNLRSKASLKLRPQDV